MRKRTVVVPLLGISVLGLPPLVASPAQAHGYTSSPPSRSAMCAQRRVSNCGAIQYEPQSVEGPKGFPAAGPADGKICSAGIGAFAPLDNPNLGWPATSVGAGDRTVTWTFTARHATTSFRYFITSGGPQVRRGNLTQIASFSGGNRQPPATVSHRVPLPNRSGRQVLLAVWGIADTGNAFYSCIDVQFGGSTNPPPNEPPPNEPPPNEPPPPPSDPPATGTWRANTAYAVGAQVTYGGRSYRCITGHTSLVGWEPPNVPALWRVA